LPSFSIDKKRFDNILLERINFIGQPKYYSELFNEDYLTKVHCQPRSNDLRPNELMFVTLLYIRLVGKKKESKQKKEKVLA
jgi:hypothetical protein